MKVMSGLSVPALLFAALTLSTALPASAESHAKRVQLATLNNSGQHGSAVLSPRGKDTFVTIDLQGTPEDVFEPAHIHIGKSCSTMNPTPTYPLHSVHGGHSYTLLHVSMTQLLNGNYAVNVHSASDITHYVACGHIDATP